jgi:hypothetical protein
MTETLTYDPSDPNASELTTEEQDSLQVGEKLAEQEEQLLAGKYKNAEELEKAYVELQQKLGSDEKSKDEEVEQTTSEDDTEPETSPEVSLLNEANKEYWDNDGKLSEETIEKFSSMSSKDLVNAYLEVTKDNPQPNQQKEVDVAQQDINSIQNSVGGEKAYKDMIQWASNSLDENAVNAFDDVVASGNVQMIKLAVAGLKAQYEDANGYEGRMLSGKAAQTSGDVFRSQAEVVNAMSDPRYDKDPAYRNDVYQKLERSDLKF